MPSYTFSTPSPARLLVENGSGRVGVRLADVAETHVEVSGQHADDVEVHQDGDGISVRTPRPRLGFFTDPAIDITVVAPTRSALDVRVGSADVVAEGSLGDVRVRSGSGDVALEHVVGFVGVESGSGDVRIERAEADVRLKSGSGDLTVGSAAGDVAVSTGSGDVTVGTAGPSTVVKSGSGGLEVGDTAGDVVLTTGSGDLVVRNARQGRVRAKGGSGDVRIGVPAGTPVWTDISSMTGRVRSEIVSAGAPEDGAAHVEVTARLMTGDVLLTHSS